MPRLRPLALSALAAACLAAVTALPAHAQSSCGTETVARNGENFLRIARRCGVPMKDLMVLNPGVNPGQPGRGTRVVVARGPSFRAADIAAAYVNKVVGSWGPTAGDCSDQGWTFAAGTIRGDREVFDILGFEGTPDDIRIVAQNRGSEEPVILNVTPAGDRLTVTGGGTLGSLRRC